VTTATAAPAPTTVAPEVTVLHRTLSAESDPWLLDHCFYRQPPGWPTVSDRYPVVPMTMTIGMMIDAARGLAPGRVAIAIEDVRAYRWMAVAPAVTIELRCRPTGPDTVDVDIPGYARATVRLGDAYPPAPAPTLPPLTAPREPPISAASMYRDRWMFHGPAYQGVVALGPMGDDGVDGAIDVLPAPGALLDCAGQLMGWWVMDHEPADRLAMPVRIERIRFHGPEPVAGRIACAVRFRSIAERDVIADLELCDGDRVWARIDAWQDRRFDSDDPVWAVLMYPERNALGVVRDGGVVEATEHWRAAASRDLIMRRYLGEAERAAFDEVAPRGRRAWLLGRIALKDAVRHHLWARGAVDVFPVEIAVANLASGRPVVTGPGCDGLRVSVAHKDELAVALVAADGRTPGVDVERIAPRPDTFVRVAFTARELALGGDRPRDEWMTRLWCAKEAVGKARDTGLGDPRRVEVREVDGDRLIVDGAVVETRRDGDLIVAWTHQEPPEPEDQAR
ncbi:MAG: polyketide synthase dehydratase domain-containing protein, partial [Myxococcales bacterium]|nr:polyketide synthase dehydratase domain-containing protein [Myxococcales bacterium]